MKTSVKVKNYTALFIGTIFTFLLCTILFTSLTKQREHKATYNKLPSPIDSFLNETFDYVEYHIRPAA
jgi:hypothetical protein